MKTPVFVSFDFDNDRKLKDFIVMQARRTDSPFNIIDLSLTEAAPEREWETKAANRINEVVSCLDVTGIETTDKDQIVLCLKSLNE